MELGGVHLQGEIVQLPKDLEDLKREVDTKVLHSPAVQAIFRQIDMNDSLSLLSFGNQAAKKISGFSDEMLNAIKRTGMKEAGELMDLLIKIMDRFDLNDFDKKKKPSYFNKLFNKEKYSTDAVFVKYESMQEEIEKVGITLKKYESNILNENDRLDNMFQHNLAYYEELRTYMAAGEMVLKQLSLHVLPEMEHKANVMGSQIEQMKLQKILQAKELLEQRIYDLRLAENVALQSLPVIKLTQAGNEELVQKIRSSFIATLPLFKQALAQTVAIKRLNAQARATQAVDEKMNELLKRHADNEELQEKIRNRLSSGSFTAMAALEKSRETILQGINDVKRIHQDAEKQWSEDTNKLERIKKRLNSVLAK